MRELEIPEKLRRMDRVRYNGSSCCVPVGTVKSALFSVDSGLRQGMPNSPYPLQLGTRACHEKDSIGRRAQLGGR